MTIAVCASCGATKRGAWTPCPRCRHDPTGKGVRAEAIALWLTDHYLSGADLEAAGSAIERGEPAPVDTSFVDQIVAEAEARGQRTLVGDARGCLPAAAPILVAVLLLLVVTLLWLSH